ncbi:hypothetical protein I3760_15G112200 [Carya illinoinensis]|nr:hypothetical protein I3760_15G112200 [Carya illinoinensis]
MIESLKPLPDQSKCCIYKVSDQNRQSNEEAYTPQEISIGPFHRNNPKLQKIEDFKLRYLKRFEGRAETKLEDIVSTIEGEEERLRECYSEIITLGSDDFVKMILVDASFIIELFKQNNWKIWNDYNREILKPWLCNRMKTDLILLKNQLPFFIIEKIYETAFSSSSKTFIELCFRQFNYYNVQHHSSHSELKHEILHFTDLLRHFCMRERRWNRRSEVTIKEIHSVT